MENNRRKTTENEARGKRKTTSSGRGETRSKSRETAAKSESVKPSGRGEDKSKFRETAGKTEPVKPSGRGGTKSKFRETAGKSESAKPAVKGEEQSLKRSYRTSEVSGGRGKSYPGGRKIASEGFKEDRNKRTAPARGKSRQGAIESEGLIRLNKYIANSGICSRRQADELILAGVVMVNGKVVTELGTKVSPADKVQYDNQTIRSEKHQYVLLNKPKGYITTTDDPFDRKTVMALVSEACKERIYPVGRLDRNTTGLLLLTNDGELAKKLTHPKHKVTKIYHAELDKPLTKNDMLKIAEGVELEDGIAEIDEIAYEEGASKREVGVELHSGKNRIVRRIFEAVGYDVVKLDRVVFAGLTKKDLPRGKWRFLTDQEINFLKMIR